MNLKLKLLDDLGNVVEVLEKNFGVTLTDEDFEFAREDMIHVFLHEACHALFYRIPWLKELHDQEHALIDEVLARILESDLSPLFGLTPHTIEEHLEELSGYDLKFEITKENLEHLAAAWDEGYKRSRDLRGFAEYCRKYLLGW